MQANACNEDRARVCQRGKYTIATVADGHGSNFVSQFVIDRLPEELFTRIEFSGLDSSSVISAFVHVDNILREFFLRSNDAAEWHAGSCALTAIIGEDNVVVANCGDSRALLVDPETKSYKFVSESHTADSETEQARLRALHPDELDVVHCRQRIVELDGNGKIRSSRWAACYVKSRLQPTRSFGDFYLKDQRAVDLCPDLVPASLFTPPYIEAVPTLERFKREPGSILVLASDGLWDYLGPEDAVEVLLPLVEKKATPDSLAEALTEKALAVAAEATDGELTVDVLKAMPPGMEKRNIHDDITAVVIVL